VLGLSATPGRDYNAVQVGGGNGWGAGDGGEGAWSAGEMRGRPGADATQAGREATCADTAAAVAAARGRRRAVAAVACCCR
jgi:hypothetical protein